MNRFANLILLLLRWIFVALPLPGYIHPDEFFQSTETMAGDFLHLKGIRTWEWNSSEPARSIIFPAVSAGLPFWLLNMSSQYFDFQISTEAILILPRLIMALFTFCIESILQRIWVLQNVDKDSRTFTLFLFRSSHVTMVFFNRTFSNTFETLLFTMLLFLVVKKTNNGDYKNWSVDNIYIGLLIALGFFCRQTFIVFAFYPIFYIGILMLSLPIINFLLCTVKFCSTVLLSIIVSSIVCVTADYFYFYSNELKTWHLTPLNLMKYNSNNENLKHHGLHPWYLHSTVNMILLFGPLYFVFIYQIFKEVTRNTTSNWKSTLTNQSTMLIITILVSIGILSLVPHQEPRFLIPLIVPLFCLISLNTKCLQSKWLMTLWLVFNLFGVTFYGFLHQAGLYPCLTHTSKFLKTDNINGKSVDLIFWKTYKIPEHLLVLDELQDNVKVYDLAGADVSMVNKTISNLSNKSQIFLFCPSSLQQQLLDNLEYKYSYKLTKQFFPHITMEDLPNLNSTKIFSEDQSWQDLYIYFKSKFSLNMYILNIS